MPIDIDKNGYELTNHGSRMFPVAGYYDELENNPVPWHWHDEMEFVLIEEGTALLSSGSDQYIVNKGYGLFTNAGVLHAGVIHDNSHCIYHSLVFHPRLVGGSMDSIFWREYLQPLLSNKQLQNCLLQPDVPWQKEIFDLCLKTWHTLKSEEPGYEFEVRALLSKVIYLLHEHSIPTSEVYSEKELRNAARIKQMLQYIQNHYTEDIRTENVAKSASISVSECLRCFRSTIHTTPIQYTIDYRIKKAAELLDTTDWKITEIGPACGFQDMSYFTRMFKRIYHCTPTEYKKRNAQGSVGIDIS